MFGEWRRCYNNEPNIEYGRFFANPVRLTPTGPSTIREIIGAHRSLCSQASEFVNQDQAQANKTIGKLPSVSQNYSLLPLYHAIVVIFDRLDNTYEKREIDWDGLVNLRKLAQAQTVLIARTGVEKGLSAPISLASLIPQSLPLDRSDVITQEFDVIRVSLAAAVQFNVSLEMRENLAFPKAKNELPFEIRLCPFAPKEFQCNEQVRQSDETWADTVIIAAEKYGCDNIFEMRYSIRRVQAGLIGENFCEFEPMPFGMQWIEEAPGFFLSR